MDAEQTRHRILDAAAMQILEVGYAGSSMSAIAARLNLTKGALTYHFSTKISLAIALTDALESAMVEAEQDALRAYPSGGTQTLVALLLSMGNRALNDHLVAAGVALFSDRSSPTFELADLISAWTGILKRLLAQASEGLAVPLDEVAEHILITNIGALLLGPRMYSRGQGQQRLTMMRLTLKSLGFQNVDRDVDQVLHTRANGILGELPPSTAIAKPSRS